MVRISRIGQSPGRLPVGRHVHPDILYLAVVTVAALVLRHHFANQIPVIETDGAFYARLAQERLLGVGEKGFHPAWPPFVPWAAALLARVLHPGMPATIEGAGNPVLVERMVRLVSVVCGSLLTVPAYFAARRLAGHSAGRTAAFLVAFHPRLLAYSAQALTEAPFALFSVSSLAAAGALLPRCGTGAGGAGGATLAADSPGGIGKTPFRHFRQHAAILAGATAGIAFLTRPEGVLLAILIPLILLERGRGMRGRTGTVLAFLVSFTVVAAPHLLRLSREAGHLTLGAKSDYNLILAYAGQPDVPRLDASRSTVNNLPGAASLRGFVPEPVPAFSLVHFAAQHPVAVAYHAAKNLGSALGAVFSLAYPPVVILFVLTLFARRRVQQEERLWGMVWLGFVGTYSLVFVFRRFFIAFLPLLIIEVAVGLVIFARRRQAWRRALAALAVAGIAAWSPFQARHTLGRDPAAVEQVALGRELARSFPRDVHERSFAERPAVMARKPFAAYYAGAPILAFPGVPPEELGSAARARGAAYVVIDERYLAVERPEYRALLGTSAAAGGLTRISVVGTAPTRAALFRVDAPESAHDNHDTRACAGGRESPPG